MGTEEPRNKPSQRIQLRDCAALWGTIQSKKPLHNNEQFVSSGPRLGIFSYTLQTHRYLFKYLLVLAFYEESQHKSCWIISLCRNNKTVYNLYSFPSSSDWLQNTACFRIMWKSFIWDFFFNMQRKCSEPSVVSELSPWGCKRSEELHS